MRAREANDEHGPRGILHLIVLLLVMTMAVQLSCKRSAASLAEDDFAIVRSGDVQAVAELLDKGARPNEAGQFGTTALAHAAKLGDLDMVALLLDHGAKRSLDSLRGGNPLFEAIAAGHDEVVLVLLEAGADPNVLHGRPLVHAATTGNEAVVTALLAAGADAAAMLDEGESALAGAVLNGHDGIVQRLLAEDGVNVDIRLGVEQETPLMIAARRGDEEIAELLLAAGADARLADRAGHTAADRAERAGFPELARRILAAADAQGEP